MERFDKPTEPLADAIRRARKAGRKRVNIAGIPVEIHQNYALFGERASEKEVKRIADK